MSNLGLKIDEGLEDLLRAEKVCVRHAAWNFSGRVWWDGERFLEQVWVHHSPVATISAASLEDLMSEVNDRFGWQ